MLKKILSSSAAAARQSCVELLGYSSGALQHLRIHIAHVLALFAHLFIGVTHKLCAIICFFFASYGSLSLDRVTCSVFVSVWTCN
jgi:hypothetical protein